MEDRVPSEIEVTTMTGTAPVEGSHALDAIREMFISQLDGVSFMLIFWYQLIK